MFHCYASLALIIVGLGLSVTMLTLGFSWWRMKHWMRLPARVTAASIATRHIPVSIGFVREEYRPSIEYEYEYRGRKYLGRRLTFRDARLWTYDETRAARQLIEPGTELRVFVSSSKPSKSIMRPVFEYRYLDFLAMVFITGVLIAGVGFWVARVMCYQGGL
jgi:hypothetical protein